MKKLTAISGLIAAIIAVFIVADDLQFILSLDATALAGTVAVLTGKMCLVAIEMLFALIFAVFAMAVNDRPVFVMGAVTRVIALIVPVVMCWKQGWYFVAGGNAKFVLVFSVIQTILLMIIAFIPRGRKEAASG